MTAIEWLQSHAHHVSLWDLTIAFFGYFIFSCVVERLTNKNGPMLWPVFGILPTILFCQYELYDWVTRALAKAGGTFRYRGVAFGGARGIITVDPANVEHMVRTRFGNYPKGKYYRERFSDLLGGGIFNADDAEWKEQRRLATSEMHSSRLVRHSYDTMRELVHCKLLKLLEARAVPPGDDKPPLDLQDVLLRFTFDNICTAALGIDPGCLTVDLPDVLFARAFEEATELTLLRFMVPPFVWKPLRFLSLGHERRLKEAVEIVHNFADKTVSDRRTELSKLGRLSDRSDLLSRLMEDNNHNYSNKFLRDFCVSFILAGRDTSSVALVWFFWLIYKHPKVEAKALSEIHQIILRRRLPVGQEMHQDVVFTPEELTDMVYLQAALSESLRLYPAVPMELKEVQEDDVLPDGTELKQGDRAMFCIFSMARIEALWGRDCEEFRPERWLRDDGQGLVSESQFKYAVFNAGPRLCVGKKFAYMQMKMVAATVLWRYSVVVAEGHRAVPKLTTTLYMKHGLPVTLRPRVAVAMKS
ncbi:cytochrome P450 86B1-like [Rhodamnia argentea]|uniref:Cytochrome P450 86B1-like n=1 Tax=Rhodamnia argentea TaxID=178133 RepID=A0A8B8QD33_9MYRT|nr:cytochrome P450 86B1-like [Rhodamnia argentea]